MRLLTLLVSTLLLLTSCSGGGGSGSSTLEPTVGLLIGDATSEDLGSIRVTIAELALIRNTGNEVPLLAEPYVLDALTREGASALVAIPRVPPGAYRDVRIRFDVTQLEVRRPDGEPVPVRVLESERTLRLRAPIVTSGRRNLNLRVDFDWDRSLEPDATVPGGRTFTVHASVVVSTSTETVDEIYGTVTAVEPDSRAIGVAIDGVVARTVRLRIDDSTELVDEDGLSLDPTTFFAIVEVGDRVEADGSLDPDGNFLATRIRIEDDDAGVAKIDGTILSVDTADQTFALQIRAVRRGFQIVVEALDALGDPGTIQVSYDDAIIAREAPWAGTTPSLTAGQSVEVEFRSFVDEPFDAQRVEIEDRGFEFQGVVTDVDDLPNRFELELSSHCFAVVTGMMNASDPVAVDLDGSEAIYLKLPQKPVIAASKIQVGMRIRVRGSVDDGRIQADDVRVRPGRIEGEILAANAFHGTLSIEWDEIRQPFGGDPLPNPVAATIGPGARIERDADTADEVFELVENSNGAPVEIRAYGVRDGNGGLELYRVRVDAD